MRCLWRHFLFERIYAIRQLVGIAITVSAIRRISATFSVSTAGTWASGHVGVPSSALIS
jgi:hypothetical protein